jgi:hypothetical protein
MYVHKLDQAIHRIHARHCRRHKAHLGATCEIQSIVFLFDGVKEIRRIHEVKVAGKSRAVKQAEWGALPQFASDRFPIKLKTIVIKMRHASLYFICKIISSSFFDL